DQRRCLEGLSRPFVRQPLGRESAQLVVDERKELTSGIWIAGRCGIEHSREVGHYGWERMDSDNRHCESCVPATPARIEMPRRNLVIEPDRLAAIPRDGGPQFRAFYILRNKVN